MRLLGGGAGAGHRDRRLGVAAGGDQGLGDVGDRARRRTAGRGSRSSAYAAPVDLVAGGHDGDLAVVLGGQRDAGVRRDRGDRGDAGHDLEAEAGLGAGRGLLGAGGVDERVAGHQPDDAHAALGLRDHDLGAGGVGQRLAVLAEAAVDELGAALGPPSGRPSTARTERGVLGALGDHHVGLADQVGGAHGQQAGVTRAAADERHPPAAGGGLRWCRGWRRCWARVMRLAFRSRSPAVSVPVRPSAVLPPRRACRSRGGCRRRRRRPGSPVADIRTASVPSGESATALTQSSSPSSPSTTSASAPIGAAQPPSSVASTARSAVTAARVCGSSRTATSRRQVVVGTGLDRQRTLPGSGQHLQRVEHLGRLVEPADPGQSGAGEHDRVVRTLADLADPGVHIAADVDDLQTEAEGVQLGGAAGRAGADAAADRQLAEGEPVAGDDDVARVLAEGYGGQRDAVGRAAVGRSLSEWTATSMRPSSSASRRALTKTPVPPSWASGRGAAVAARW